MEVEVKHFFNLIRENRLKDAEKLMEDIRKRFDDSRRNKGYIKALEGLLLTLRNNDKYLYLTSNAISSNEKLQSIREEFENHVKNEFHDEYDIGYFTALLDYLDLVLKSSDDSSKRDVEPIQD